MSRPVWDAIELELARQKRLKEQGKFKHTADDLMREGRVAEMLAILTEEIGEIARVVNDNGKCAQLRDELIQVAAVAVSALNGLDYAMVAKASAI